MLTHSCVLSDALCANLTLPRYVPVRTIFLSEDVREEADEVQETMEK